LLNVEIQIDTGCWLCECWNTNRHWVLVMDCSG